MNKFDVNVNALLVADGDYVVIDGHLAAGTRSLDVGELLDSQMRAARVVDAEAELSTRPEALAELLDAAIAQ